MGRKWKGTMVHYPNKKKDLTKYAPHEQKRYTGMRGMNLEEDITMSNKYYLERDIAVIYKKPTPVQIVRVDYPKRSAAKITEAYFRKPSTTDYNGLYKGHYIDFEAKETKTLRFPFANIWDHQINHLDAILRHGGVAFIMIAFTTLNEVYLLDASYMIEKYRSDGVRHIDYDYIKEKGHLVNQGYAPRLDYLRIIDRYYLKEEENENPKK